MNDDFQTLCNQEWNKIWRKYRLQIVSTCNEHTVDFWEHVKWKECLNSYVLTSKECEYRVIKDREGWKIQSTAGWLFFHQHVHDAAHTRLLIDGMLTAFHQRKGELLCTMNTGKSIC